MSIWQQSMYTKYTLYTGEVYRVYFAIPRLSEDFLGMRGFKQTDSNANWLQEHLVLEHIYELI
jgi:hypothetical protein